MCLTFNELKMWWAEKVSLIWNLFLHHPLTQIKTLMSSHTHLPLELLTLLFHLPTSLLPLHSLLVDPWQHSLTYTLHHHCHQTWRSGGLWRTVLSQICCFFLLGVFFFFGNIHPHLSRETELLTHPVRHPCQPPQVETQSSSSCIIMTFVFSSTGDLCFKILAGNSLENLSND